MNQLQARILDWAYSWEPMLKLVVLVAVFTLGGAVIGYCIGHHFGYWAALSDGPWEPMKYHEIVKGMK